MSPIFSSPSLSGASKIVWGIFCWSFLSCGTATSAGPDAVLGAVPPAPLELPTPPGGSSPLNLSVDTPRGRVTWTVMIRDDADDAEVSAVIAEGCREAGGTHEQASVLSAQWRLHQLQHGPKGYVLNPQTKRTFQRFLGKMAVLAGEQPFTMLETGSWEGGSASWLAQNLLQHPASLLVCLDSWDVAHRADYAGFNIADVEERFHSNIAKAPNGERVIAFKGDPQTSLAGLLAKGLTATFDAVFVDASHEMKDVLGEGLLSFRLLKIGGIMIFDDNWMRRVTRATAAFEEALGGSLQVLLRDENHLVVTKTANDRFTRFDTKVVLGDISKLEILAN